jgi:hypothetical protein
MQLESRNLAAGTINVRLAAVRRLAYEAADAGLLSPELAAGIRRVQRLFNRPRSRHALEHSPRPQSADHDETAHNRPDDLTDAYLVKPIEREEFIRTLHRLIDQRVRQGDAP